MGAFVVSMECPIEEFGSVDLLRPRTRRVRPTAGELRSASPAGSGSNERSSRSVPLAVTDGSRKGIELAVDQGLFDDAGAASQTRSLRISRAQRAARPAWRRRSSSSARAERANGWSVDGEPLTCELLKEHIQAVPSSRTARSRGHDRLARAGQTAVGHDMGSWRLSPRTTSSSSTSSRWTSSQPATRTSRARLRRRGDSR